MLLIIFATFCVALSSGFSVRDEGFLPTEDELNDLFWPERYTVKAIKITLKADLVEDMVIWKTNQTSRVDYNNGAVKIFTTLPTDENDENDEGEKYEVHPETSLTEEITTVCYGLGEAGSLDDILPSLDDNDYKAVGNETIINIETVKFEYLDKNFEENVKTTIWAYYKDTGDEDGGVWVPVMYEKLEYNNLLGLETVHELWYFSEFNTDFEDEVFDVDQYDCSGPDWSTKLTKDSDMVTKELVFIDPENEKHVDHIFNSFKTKYERHYEHETEHAMRRSILKQNMRLVSSVNRRNLTYKLAINQFADRTHEEMIRHHTGLKKRPEGKSGNIPFPHTESSLEDLVKELPVEYDARLHGLVGSVKDQKTCGSCWTYGTTAAAEGALARVNGGRLMSLSNQALIDCAWAYGNMGCDGGTDVAAFEWMMKYGLPTEEDYGPYKNKDGFCHVTNITRYPIRGFTDVTPFSVNALKVALVNNGPLSVSVEVTSQFGLYSRGIYYEDGCGPGNLNHEVSLVAYGQQDGEFFWVLKNSWGTKWGNAGYMMISAKHNNCGVATEPTYVVF